MGLFPGRGWGRRTVAPLPLSPQLQGQTTPDRPQPDPDPPPPGPAAEVCWPEHQVSPPHLGGRVGRLAGPPWPSPRAPGSVLRVAVCGVPRQPALTASGAHLRGLSPPRVSGGSFAGLGL
ncbi:hypothetical protein NDU88_002281 [Pleurodeles waltl]|uniref:Uncharacterized protein n=1 Tax=Pleurodeles waltl TaxID=8319 RepID=A0AAV7LC31_PLEWA|nr:hypothetical protein NDU88_002281 [Pleurodeles waltl]